MNQPRVLPCLTLRSEGLVKTARFGDPRYIGDPRNAVRIFNEKEVDELVLLDIFATVENRGPQLALIREIVTEAFMPVAYGGGIRNIEDVRAIFKCGVEKVVLGKQAFTSPSLVIEVARQFGSQSLVVCVDVKKNLFGSYVVMVGGGRQSTKQDPVSYALNAEKLGAGEILLNSIDRDGTMEGYDLALINAVSGAVGIPVIACGGAGKAEDFGAAVREGASAVAAGSLFVYHGRHRAVLISYPSPGDLKRVFAP